VNQARKYSLIYLEMYLGKLDVQELFTGQETLFNISGRSRCLEAHHVKAKERQESQKIV